MKTHVLRFCNVIQEMADLTHAQNLRIYYSTLFSENDNECNYNVKHIILISKRIVQVEFVSKMHFKAVSVQ